jgi:HlyD family secretion protein
MNNRQLANRQWPEHEFTDAIEAPIERKLIRNVTFMIICSIFCLLVWSIFSEVEEIAKAQGQVVPLGHRQIIQSQLGGTIDSIVVEEGDVVKKGDVLVNFIAIDSQSAKEELASTYANLMMKKERLTAFKERREADFNQYNETYPRLVLQQRQALLSMNSELSAIESLSNSDVAKTQAELNALEKEVPALKDQIDASEKTVTMMKKLAKTGGVSQLKLLETQQKLDSYQRELSVLEGKEEVLTKNLTNVDEQLKNKKASLLKIVGETLTETQGEILSIEARQRSSDSDVSQNTVIAPVNGIIQSIPSSSVGSVIQPGGTVVVIVPVTEKALIEAKLSPRDIGFVSVGQKARIKIDAFDYSRYGALDGIVKKISPSTDADERGGVFYKVQIAIDKPYFGKNPGELELIPGMTGEADIVTGDKTIFQYLWKPVFTNVTSAFGER